MDIEVIFLANKLMNELIEKNQIREVYFKGKQSLPMYDRYMVIGRW